MPNPLLLFFFFLSKFIYLWLHWVFVAVHGLYLVAGSGGYSSLWCTGFSLLWLLFLQSRGSGRVGSVVVAHRPSCSAACGILSSGPWIKPTFPASAGGFVTTVPPGKSLPCFFFFFFFFNFIYLFIYLWLCWVFVSVRGLSLVAASGGQSSSRCVRLSPSRPLVAEHRL